MNFHVRYIFNNTGESMEEVPVLKATGIEEMQKASIMLFLMVIEQQSTPESCPSTVVEHQTPSSRPNFDNILS